MMAEVTTEAVGLGTWVCVSVLAQEPKVALQLVRVWSVMGVVLGVGGADLEGGGVA